MAKLSANYETVAIFNVQTGDEGIAALSEKFKALISENGTITNVEEWGKRRLAYPINDQNDGYYVLINFDCDGEFIAELDRIFNITDGIIRSMTVRL